MPALAFPSVVPRLFGLEPVRELTLIGDAESLHRLSESIYLRRLHGFGLRGDGYDDATVAAIIDALPAIEKLELEGFAIGTLTLEALGRTMVRSLSLRFSDVHLAALMTILRSPLASYLEVLVLDDNPLGNDAAMALARCEALGRIRRLSLGGVALGAIARESLEERFGEKLDS